MLYLLRFSKKSPKTNVILKKFLKGRHFLLDGYRKVNIRLFWEAKVKCLKIVVWLILSKQFES